MGDTQGASEKIQESVGTSGDTVDYSAVRGQVDSALTSANVTSAQDLNTVSRELEKQGVLPSILLDEQARNQLFDTYAGDDKVLSKEELQRAVQNDASGYNRLLAQSLLNRYDMANTIGADGEGLSRNDADAWARMNWSRNPNRYQMDRGDDGSMVTKEPRMGAPLSLTSPDGRETVFERVGAANFLKTIHGPDDRYQISGQGDRPIGPGMDLNITDRTGRFGAEQLQGKMVEGPNADGTFKYEVQMGNSRLTVIHNRDNTEVALNEKNQVQSILRADGSSMSFERGADDAITKIVERGADGKVIAEYTPGEAGKPWNVNGKAPEGNQRQIMDPAVDANSGVVTYNSADGKHIIARNGTERTEAAAATQPAPAGDGEQGKGGSKTQVTRDGDTVTKIERVNQGGSEKETIERTSDGTYRITRTGADGATTTEFAKTLEVRGDNSYTFTTDSGARVTQNADGSRVVEADGTKTTYTYGDDGKPTKIERVGKGGVSETLTLVNGEWQISRPDNSAGGKVDAVRINSDGSYSYVFMGTLNTQETMRNIREEKRPNGDNVRIGFDKDGNTEFVVRNFQAGRPPQNHQEQVKRNQDGSYSVTMDGKPVEAKDIKVYPGGGYEYTRNQDGTKIYQDGNTRRETRADGVEMTSTVLPSGNTETKTKYANGDTHAVTTDAQGKPVSIVHVSTESGKTETVTFDEAGQPKGIVVSDTNNPNNKVEGQNFKFENGNYSYDLPLDPNNPNKVRRIEQNLDGSRKEVTLEPYKVQGGDYLYKLARERGVSLQDIIDAQPPELKARLQKNPNLIITGETLVMPSDKKEIASPVQAARPADDPNKEEYTVRPGDTLTKIARDRGVTVDALIAEIKGFDPELGKRLEENRNFIRAGEKLPVRKKAATPAR